MHPFLGLMKACLILFKGSFRPDAPFFKASGLLKLRPVNRQFNLPQAEASLFEGALSPSSI